MQGTDPSRRFVASARRFVASAITPNANILYTIFMYLRGFKVFLYNIWAKKAELLLALLVDPTSGYLGLAVDRLPLWRIRAGQDCAIRWKCVPNPHK